MGQKVTETITPAPVVGLAEPEKEYTHALADASLATARHMATLSAGTIVVMAGFLSQSEREFIPWTMWVLAAAFVSMLAVLFLSVKVQFTLIGIVAQIAGNPPDAKDRILHHGRAWRVRSVFATWMFTAGLVCIALFCVVNIGQMTTHPPAEPGQVTPVGR